MAGYTLKKIPPEIFKFILDEQNRLKRERCTNKFSFETTIYKLLREYMQARAAQVNHNINGRNEL